MFLPFKSFINSSKVSAYLYINGEYKKVIPYIFRRPRYLYTADGKAFYDGLERPIRLGVPAEELIDYRTSAIAGVAIAGLAIAGSSTGGATIPRPIILISSGNEIITDSNDMTLTLMED
jgi:hypothetical protein